MLCKIILLIGIFSVVFCDPPIPSWPPNYTTSLIFSTPYFRVDVPVEAVIDKIRGRQYISYYSGMDTYISLFDENKVYHIGPKKYELVCHVSASSRKTFSNVLPSMNNWKFHKTLNNGNNQWKINKTVYNYNNTYLFEITKEGIPVRLEMHGANIILHSSHVDHYVVTYTSFTNHIKNPNVFNVPQLCIANNSNNNLYYRSRALESYFFDAINPPENFDDITESIYDNIDTKFKNFVINYKKVYSSYSEMLFRSSIFARNLNFIEDHNARDDVIYKLNINKFADMETEEIQSLITPTRYTNISGFHAKKHIFEYFETNENPPPEVNWVTKGVVNPPKDQGFCGSCWAFSSTALIESAYAMKFGKLLSHSEQQIIDCCWDSGLSMGCDGGFPSDALMWAYRHKSLALEKDYPYLMVNGFCKDQIYGPEIQPKFIEIAPTVTSLANALSRFGPISVSMNSGLRDFHFFSGNGIYDNPSCYGSVDHLNHAVLLVGYGNESINGVDTPYWLIKNSWGEEWGDKGYVKIFKSDKNICGILSLTVGLYIP